MSFFNLLRTAALAVAALVAFGAAPAQAEWRKATTEHFVIYGDASEGALRNYAQKVERFDHLLRTWVLPRDPNLISPRLAIYLADGRDDMRKVWPDIPANVGGFLFQTATQAK